MSQKIDRDRRTAIKSGTAFVGTLLGVGVIGGTTAGQSYDYELVVKAESGSGKFAAHWNDYEYVDHENLENGDSAQCCLPTYDVELWVDDTFAPYKDIVRFNASSWQPAFSDTNNPGNISVTIDTGSDVKVLV